MVWDLPIAGEVDYNPISNDAYDPWDRKEYRIVPKWAFYTGSYPAYYIDITKIGTGSTRNDGKGGWDLLMYRFGTAGKPRIMIDCELHGNEFYGHEVLQALIGWMLSGSDADAIGIRTQNEVLVVPVVNYRFGRTNFNTSSATTSSPNDPGDSKLIGVNLARNFYPGWVASTPTSDSYSGVSEESEQETKAIHGVFDVWNPKVYVNLHQGSSNLGGYYSGSAAQTTGNKIVSLYNSIKTRLGVTTPNWSMGMSALSSNPSPGYAYYGAAAHGIVGFLNEVASGWIGSGSGGDTIRASLSRGNIYKNCKAWFIAIAQAVSGSGGETLSVNISPLTSTIGSGSSQLYTSTVAGGTTPYSYQWFSGSGTTYNSVAGATSTSWTYWPTAGTRKVYLRTIDAVPTTVTSTAATLTVTAPPAVAITISPTSASMNVNNSQIFTSAVTGGTAPFTYKWYLDLTEISGATSSTYTYTPTVSGNYTIYAQVTDSLSQTDTSNSATITVNDVPAAVNEKCFEPEKRASTPNTAGWGTNEEGRLWCVTGSSNTFSYWDGTGIVSFLQSTTGTISVPASYVFYKDNGYYYSSARDGVLTSGSNFVTLINSAITTASGGHIYVSSGSYQVESSIIINQDGTHLEGAGWSTVFSGSNLTENIIKVSNTYNVWLENFRIDGANQTSGHGIYVISGSSGDSVSFQLEKTLIENCAEDGAHLGAPTWIGTIGQKIRHCIFRCNRSNGLYIDYDATDSEISHCSLYSNTGAGVVLNASSEMLCYSNFYDNYYGLNIGPLPTGNVRRLRFVGNSIHHNRRHGIYWTSSRDFYDNTFAGNTFCANGTETNNAYDDIYLSGATGTNLGNIDSLTLTKNVFNAIDDETNTRITRYAINDARSILTGSVIISNIIQGHYAGGVGSTTAFKNVSATKNVVDHNQFIDIGYA